MRYLCLVCDAARGILGGERPLLALWRSFLIVLRCSGLLMSLSTHWLTSLGVSSFHFSSLKHWKNPFVGVWQFHLDVTVCNLFAAVVQKCFQHLRDSVKPPFSVFSVYAFFSSEAPSSILNPLSAHLLSQTFFVRWMEDLLVCPPVSPHVSPSLFILRAQLCVHRAASNTAFQLEIWSAVRLFGFSDLQSI